MSQTLLTLIAIAGLGYAFYHLWRVFRPEKKEKYFIGMDLANTGDTSASVVMRQREDDTFEIVSIENLIIEPDKDSNIGWGDVAKRAEYWLEWHESFAPNGRVNGTGEATYTVTFRSLQDQLQKAIQTENYEEAARLRDKIKEEE